MQELKWKISVAFTAVYSCMLTWCCRRVRVPQLLTCLVRNEGKLILNLLSKIGSIYPQAIYFPIRTLYLTLKIEQRERCMYIVLTLLTNDKLLTLSVLLLLSYMFSQCGVLLYFMYHVLYSIACCNPATGCYMIINSFISVSSFGISACLLCVIKNWLSWEWFIEYSGEWSIDTLSTDSHSCRPSLSSLHRFLSASKV